MTTSRSTASTSDRLRRLAVAAALACAVLVGLGGVAQARRRIVFLDFTGPRARAYQDQVESVLRRGNSIVPASKWYDAADRLRASRLTARDVSRVAARLNVDGVVVGKIDRRGSRYFIHLHLREGKSGESVAEAELVVRTSRLTSTNKSEIRDQIGRAIDDLPPPGEDVGGDDRDRDTRDRDTRDRDRDRDRNRNRNRNRDTRDRDRLSDRDRNARDRDARDRDARDRDARDRDSRDRDTRDRDARDRDARDRDARDRDARDRDRKRGFSGHDRDSRDRDTRDRDARDSRDRDARDSRDRDARDSRDRDTRDSRDRDDRGDRDRDDRDRDDRDRDDRDRVADRDDRDDRDRDRDRDEERIGGRAELPGPDARHRPFDALAGLSFTARSLTFRGDPTITKPQGYKSSLPIPGAYVAATVYPLAFNRHNHGITRDLGLTAVVDKVLSIKSKISYTDSGMTQTAELNTSELHYALGVVFRYDLGKKPMSPQLTASVRYSRRKFVIDRTPIPMGALQVPDTSYTYFDPGAGIRYPLSPKLTLVGDARFLIVTSTGQMQSLNYYGGAKVLGFAGQAGADYVLNKKWFVHGTLHATTLGFTFNGTGALTTSPDGDPTTVDVHNARDTYYGAIVTAGYLY